MTDELKTATTWQERAVLELNELSERTLGLGTALVKGVVTDEQVKALMQAQYKAMIAYGDALSQRLRVCGVIDTETPPHVRVYGEQRAEVRGTPACVEVTVTAPAGKRAEVSLGSVGGPSTRWTVAEGQSQSWSVMTGEGIGVSEEDTSTVAHKRPAG